MALGGKLVRSFAFMEIDLTYKKTTIMPPTKIKNTETPNHLEVAVQQNILIMTEKTIKRRATTNGVSLKKIVRLVTKSKS